jgi:hypothetical protein
MEENVLMRFIQALATGSIRVADLSQLLDAGTPTIALPPEFRQELAVPPGRDFPL